MVGLIHKMKQHDMKEYFCKMKILTYNKSQNETHMFDRICVFKCSAVGLQVCVLSLLGE